MVQLVAQVAIGITSIESQTHPRDTNEFHKEEEVLWRDIYKNQADEEFKNRLWMNSHSFDSVLERM